MANNIDVFSTSTGGSASSNYQIALIGVNRQQIMVKADRNIDVNNVFPAFMRYKSGRNGSTLYLNPEQNQYAEDLYFLQRPKKQKWFAFRWTNAINNSHLYDTCSLLFFKSTCNSSCSPYMYELNWRGDDGTDGGNNISDAICSAFDCRISNQIGITHVYIHGHTDVTNHRLQNREYIGWNCCGIALVDRHGNLKSNIARLKVVLKIGQSEFWLYPMRDK